MPVISWVYDNTSYDTHWHIDSESCDSECHVTVIAYLQIDKNAGGEFLTEQKSTLIDSGSVIVFHQQNYMLRINTKVKFREFF